MKNKTNKEDLTYGFLIAFSVVLTAFAILVELFIV